MTNYWHFSITPERYISLAADSRWHVSVQRPAEGLDYSQIMPNDIAVFASTKPPKKDFPVFHQRIVDVYRFSRMRDLLERIPAREVFPERDERLALNDLADYLIGTDRDSLVARQRLRSGIVAVELGDVVGLQAGNFIFPSTNYK